MRLIYKLISGSYLYTNRAILRTAISHEFDCHYLWGRCIYLATQTITEFDECECLSAKLKGSSRSAAPCKQRSAQISSAVINLSTSEKRVNPPRLASLLNPCVLNQQVTIPITVYTSL